MKRRGVTSDDIQLSHSAQHHHNQVTDWTSVLHASRLALLLPDATELASSLELRKHKREKRDCKTESVCGAKKLQGFKAQGAKNPTPLHKAKLPTASVRGNVQGQFGKPHTGAERRWARGIS